MKSVEIFARTFGLIGALTIFAMPTAQAEVRCSSAPPKPFPSNQPFLLNDPRSGLMLYVESDGRHMAAITHDGKIVWQKNLFDGPRLRATFPPNIEIPGEPRVSDEEWERRARVYIDHLSIDRIGLASDCAAHVIDHDLSRAFHGHYIAAGSGTRIDYFLDAKTGDFVVGPIN
jgi:hypothetical protein